MGCFSLLKTIYFLLNAPFVYSIEAEPNKDKSLHSAIDMEVMSIEDVENKMGMGGAWSYHSCVNVHRDYTYRRCRMRNICYRRGNKWLYFISPSSLATIERYQKNKNPQLRIGKGSYTFFKLGVHEDNKFTTVNIGSSISDYMLANNIDTVYMHKKTTFIARRHSCQNAGHCYMQSLFPVFKLMETYGKFDHDPNVFENTVLFDEEYDGCGCKTWPGNCGKNSANEITNLMTKLCHTFTNMYFSTITNNPVVHRDDILSHNLSKSMICFSEVYGGAGRVDYYSDNGNQLEEQGNDFRRLRNLVYERNHVSLPSVQSRLIKQFCVNEETPVTTIVLQVLIAIKKGKRSIINMMDISQFTNLYTFAMTAIWQCNKSKNSNIQRNFSVTFNTTIVEWENTTNFKDQLSTLSNADIYVTSGGSGAMNALLLPDDSVMILGPFCEHTIWCDQYEVEALFDHMPYFETIVYHVTQHNDEVLQPTEKGDHNNNIRFLKKKYLRYLKDAAMSILSKI